VVIAVMNEEDNIIPLIESLKKNLSQIDHEVIFVDDGSTDLTVDKLLEYAFDGMKVLEFTKNYGQSTAMQAGIDESIGEYIVTLDGDLQNDPSDIPILLEKIENEPFDLIAGERINRKDGMFLRKIPSKIANGIIRNATDVHIRDYGCTLKIFKSYFAKKLDLYGELHRFIPVLASLQGARILQVPVKHHPRIHGKSKYSLNRTFKVISDLILMVFMKKYLRKPMHLFGNLGFVIFGLGILINLYLLILKIFGQDIWGRPILILGVLLILAGFQLIIFGIVSELLMRTYFESQQKKTYNIRKIHTLEE
tara:strand:+ start:20573 stop:21496 length:924 start_codon:yes stop_codon:yes gene_type:complete